MFTSTSEVGRRENVHQKLKAGITSEMITALYSEDVQQQLFATQKFNELFSRVSIKREVDNKNKKVKKTKDNDSEDEDAVEGTEDNKKEQHRLIDEGFQAGFVPRFVEFLKHNENSTLLFETACALTNITSGTWFHRFEFVREDLALPLLIRLLDSEYDDVQEQAVQALRNLAIDRSKDLLEESTIITSGLVLEKRILVPLFRLLSRSTRVSRTRDVVQILSNLLKGEDPPSNLFKRISPYLQVLSRLLFHSDTDVLFNACKALSYISYHINTKYIRKEYIQAVIDAGVCRGLVELLMHRDQNVVYEALKAYGHLVSCYGVLQKQVILNCDALPYLLLLLSSPKENIREKACFTICNSIAFNDKQQIQAVIDANIFPVVIEILRNAELNNTMEIAAKAIINFTFFGSPEQVRYLVEQQCIPPLCELLTVKDNKIIQVALNGLENILRRGEQDAKKNGTVNPYAGMIEGCHGLDKIKYLLSHENMQIYEATSDLIECYFGMD